MYPPSQLCTLTSMQGITKDADLLNECLRFLTHRGTFKANGEFTGQLNRPVLLWSDGSTITMQVTLLMMNLYTNFVEIEGSS